MDINEMMTDLITNKYYKTKEEIVKKLSVFYAWGVITEEQYNGLMKLTNENYPEE